MLLELCNPLRKEAFFGAIFNTGANLLASRLESPRK